MAGITVNFKIDAREMFRKVGQTSFMNAARRWGYATATNLEFWAKQGAPVDKSRLSTSITHQVIESENNIIARTGTNVFYAPYQEFGTGIYGPRKQMIRPRTAKVLRWPKRGGGFVFARQVRGVKPRAFFASALTQERPYAEKRIDNYIKEEMSR